MAYYCSECTYLDLDDVRDGKFWCEKRYERHGANEIECNNFCKAYNRSSSESKNAYDYSKEKTSSGGGCYLTTIICNILELPDNNIYLETLRKFRNKVLQKDIKYKELLVEYDIIGPKIANAINDDPLKKLLANKLFNNYIIPITWLINEGNIENAVESYKNMTNELKNLYKLNNETISIIDINEADITKSGHGKYIKQKRIALQ